MTKEKNLVIVAAGTGGHVMPGLAVARVMRSRGWNLSWIGTTTGMEGALVAKDAIPFDGLAFRGVRGRGLLGTVKGGFALIRAFFEARRLLKEHRVGAMFSTGGYVAVPVGFAARTLGLPIVVMNCDADLLMSTNTLLPFCDALACGFSGGARSFAGDKGRTTGNPVRADIVAVEPAATRFEGRTGPLRLFVFGGSLGARVFNEVVPEALARIPEAERPSVVHQTGRGNGAAVAEHYERLGVKAEVVEFIDDMAARYAECDLVLCRAGATSVAELCAAGVPAILVPFIARTTNHQLGNARYMADNGAAIMIEQASLTPEGLASTLSGLDRGQLAELGAKARGLSRPDAASAVADLVEEVVAKRSR